MILSVVLLPLVVLVLVPAALLWVSGSGWTPAGSGDLLTWIGGWLGLAGLGLTAWTIRLTTHARARPSGAWPPERLVILGPYAHVRNPMILAGALVLAGESLVLRSWVLGAWTISFVSVHTLYFPCIEERALERRFGGAYRAYREQVPRWIPRRRASIRPDDSVQSPEHLDWPDRGEGPDNASLRSRS